MSPLWLLAAIFVFALVGSFLGRSRAIASVNGNVSALHSRPGYYGSYVLIWTALPAIVFMVAVMIAQPIVNNSVVDTELRTGYLQACSHAMGGIEGEQDADQPKICSDKDEYEAHDTRRALMFGVVSNVADGLTYLSEHERIQLRSGLIAVRPTLAKYGVALAENVNKTVVHTAYRLNEVKQLTSYVMYGGIALLLFLGLFLSYRRIQPALRARNLVEANVKVALILASSIAILTTVGIVFSMLFEAIHFFGHVNPLDFFFGTSWDPRFSSVGRQVDSEGGTFGLIPLLWGTLYISMVALLVAVPIGLFAAIYMAEYATKRVRATAKPLLEILAGIPTIVYGFFALVTIGPFFRDAGASIGLTISANSVLTAGFVMGIMLIPFISSLSDDIITAVPQSLRDGSLGLGATRSETIKRVILPAALPGIVGSILLAASRAIGETMIVVMAAGIAANLTANPFEAVTTVTVKIVSQLTGDLEFTSPQTLVAFALGITLFCITLGLNVFALHIVRKYREQYD
ncbi:phosphate ABC transporter permease subunit PstC [Cohaesibacter sp. CAU 1516]|uniref:phosphate ABC transporter permease subunit PstC n=1 Tax=Cohaesibacter sp. CAU 1516 TaxID=2576038 RepID=UPI0010FD1D75|nr:phosphate ABC transporter permease subunit PstC [Cohaesibacter sp. CAU 1516]TLP45957.1 phosphate ABC transporter permease subunit PstC [Cohaesibacter sp. CAU 1516]